MDPFAIITVVKTCYTIGVQILDICSNWRHAETEVQKRVIVVESCWNRTKSQVDFMVRITSIMDPDQCRVMDELLKQLLLSLSLAKNTLEGVTQKTSSVRSSIRHFGFKSKAAWVFKKEALDSVVSELEAWQRRFDPSWFLLMKIASPILESELAKATAADERVHEPANAAKNPLALAAGLRKVLSPSLEQTRSLFLPEVQMEWVDIPFSNVKAGRRQDGDNKWYIVDTIELGQATRVREIARDVRVLAAKLSQADPLAFSLLNCKGVIPITRQHVSPALPQPDKTLASHSAPPCPHSHSPGQKDYSHFQLVFRIPRGMEVLQSLRQLLLHSDVNISLSRKIHVAREISKAVNYVHTFSFVHKNVRPESVLCFEDARSTSNYAFLVGFDAFRAADAGTMMGGDMSWARNVYRHPDRQGMDPSEKYSMQHDIYSLGVCLLEIGLWESFVEYVDEPGPNCGLQSKFGKTYYDFLAWSQKKGQISSFDGLAILLKDYLVEQASTRLAPRMGDKYAHVVVSCLTCLDDDNEDFAGLEAMGDDRIGVQFIDKIMKTLDKISL
ncbi:hypothetical protein BGW36DRAFT_414266 [Talaromyces proteolyticus]|uniref:Protein kinase domain-containing protein n=1 Tax=Talaromyces proteolyticus TaxID=1131652 RepID=A0AAD4KYI7_9EURO|nr:uncharacterized protein BGW36DRAFT_414266 [Talaromyces proteolyticus]KAH8703901.1 hypothetical protein BGW36DRAFT_414266 [Talaromyces proteolyticus]